MRVSDIRIDGGTQARQSLDESAVSEYADRMRDGELPPPVIVYFDGSAHWLADGFHRFHAARAAGLAEIPADIRNGTRREAILHAAGANADHGVRRTNADKRKAVLMLLQDSEWQGWSDREIARRCRVEHHLVGSCRKSLGNSPSEPAPQTADQQPRTYTTKHGTEAVMNTSNIGKREADEQVPEMTPQIELPKSRGVALAYSCKAIEYLQMIPLADGLRDEAFDSVVKWISDNR